MTDYRQFDHRVKCYSASTVDEAFRLIVEDPKRYFRTLFRRITYNRLSENDEQEFFSYLTTYLWERNWERPEAFLEQFNNSAFTFTFAAVVRNQTHQKAAFTKLLSPIDQASQYELDLERPEEFSFEIPSDDAPLEEEKLTRNVHPRDPDFLLWLLRTDQALEEFSTRERYIYRSYLYHINSKGKIPTVKALSRRLKFNYRECRKVLLKVGKWMKMMVALYE